jgi:ribosomal protein L32
MGNNAKKKRLGQIRKALGVCFPKEPKTCIKKGTRQLMMELTGIDISLCPKCQERKLRKIGVFDGVYRKALSFLLRHSV